PLVDLDTGTVVGFEALARWRHPTSGMLMPDLFIPVAEETGLVVEIGAWMLAEACRQMRDWQTRYPNWSTLGISVNVSGRQLSHGVVAADVERVLGATGLDPACLTLEITESALVHSLSGGAGVIERLHAMSVALHLDDFGTGYSSLAYLQQFPVDIIKIDRAFIAGTVMNGPNAALVHALVELGNALGLETVAEGIETADQLVWLQREGCHAGQGFYFSYPLEAGDAELFLSAADEDTLAAGPGASVSP
ncbi:MAG TPA: EAL domain-containing protein, partial [Acidimicrobiales bacterium]